MKIARIHSSIAYALVKAHDGEAFLKAKITWQDDFSSFPLPEGVYLIRQRFAKDGKCQYFLQDPKGGITAEEMIRRYCNTNRCLLWVPVISFPN